MEKARKLLTEKSDFTLEEYLVELADCYLPITDKLAEAREDLTKRKAQYCKPKMGTADWVFLADTVADLQREVDELDGLKQAVQNQLDVGRAVL